MTTWKLYYGDRTTFSSDDGEWVDAPFLNVAGLAYPEPGVIRQIVTGDFYLASPWTTTPYSPDAMGLLDYLRSIGHPTITTLMSLSLDDMEAAGVKLGRMYDNHVWRELWEWIVADADRTWG